MPLGFLPLLIAALLGLASPAMAQTEPTQAERAARPELDKIQSDITFLEARLKTQKTRQAALSGELTRLARERQALEDELAGLVVRLRSLLPKLWEMDVRLKGMMSAPAAPWDETDRSLNWLGAQYSEVRGELSRMSLKNSELTANLGKEAEIKPEADAQAAQVEKTRDAILEARLKLRRELASVRHERAGPQERLEQILELVAQAELSPAMVQGKPLNAAQGQLARPVAGEQVRGFDPGASPPHNGVGFKTAKGEAVRAAYWGRVAYVGEIKGLGQVVVLAHGGAAATVYAHLARAGVKAGQDVARGEALGVAGEFPSPGSSGMSFELRFGVKPSNPSRWFVAGHVAVPTPAS
ncbi:MAG: murein hydrolase activator EnvC family protein [Acidobacteriota bacterium]